MTRIHAGIFEEPSSGVAAINQESNVTFTCEASWLRSDRQRLDRFCRFSEINLESEEAVSMQLALSLEWEIDQMGPFKSTESLTPALIQRGITISTTCMLCAEQVFEIFMLQQRDCEDRITADLLPYCTSDLIIPTVVANNNTNFRCSVRPLQCTVDDYVDRSSTESLRLRGRTLYHWM